MSEDKITYSDVREYETLFTLAPTFLLERFARKNTNLVSKFESIIQGYLDNLTSDQKHKLAIILNSDVDDLQNIMNESYSKTGKKQFMILANPKYKQFIVDNLESIRKMI
ncbi:MAG: hypothetical protein IJ258_10075 [Methanobrevibacter sp.]|uniref:hypothetical protein n=1 Tax=Methanobrevibacter sp. TaxID=66852 RepID=UPI0025CC837C|nr:hypothetical protein [Methanobrevibacter sp.]MBQ8018433.1 hypothetical protein [Methanobrevibacter sp.]